MTTPIAFDLSSFLDLQRQYVQDLSGISISSASTETPVVNLKQKLDTLQSTYTPSIMNSNEIILKQETINGILNTENDRLNNIKTNISSAITGQQRIIQLNNSYSKKYKAYTNIIMLVVIAIIIYVCFILLYKAFPLIIPKTLIYFLIIGSLSCIFIYIIILYNQILNRDSVNFDELYLPPPNVVSNKKLV